MPAMKSQCASAVLMVRPARFAFNAETAVTNRFQRETGAEDLAARALAEFDAMAAALASEGVNVCVAQDSPQPHKPDAVFPNNWVSFHADGTVVLYPMQAQSRRLERRPEIIDTAIRESGYRLLRTLDLTHHENSGRFLEGTGSLVIDHRERVAYACHSPRTDADVAAEWAREMGHELVMFSASDESGTPIYHTNVLLSIGSRAVIVALDAIAAADRARVADRLRAGGRELIAISMAEMHGFAGNMLEVGSWDENLGDFHLLVMSRSARTVLSADHYARACASADAVLSVPVDTIERHGGGSVRCMLAEIFS